MKKLFITIITLILLFGCTSQKELNNSDKTYPDETSKNILSYDQVTSKELIYYSLDEYNEYLAAKDATDAKIAEAARLENYRNELRSVRIIGFDELLARVNNLLSLMEVH